MPERDPALLTHDWPTLVDAYPFDDADATDVLAVHRPYPTPRPRWRWPVVFLGAALLGVGLGWATLTDGPVPPLTATVPDPPVPALVLPTTTSQTVSERLGKRVLPKTTTRVTVTTSKATTTKPPPVVTTTPPTTTTETTKARRP